MTFSENDGSSSSSSDDGIMDADDELRMKLQQETGFGGENMKFVDMTKSKKKKNKGKNIEQQLPLGIGLKTDYKNDIQ